MTACVPNISHNKIVIDQNMNFPPIYIYILAQNDFFYVESSFIICCTVVSAFPVMLYIIYKRYEQSNFFKYHLPFEMKVDRSCNNAPHCHWIWVSGNLPKSIRKATSLYSYVSNLRSLHKLKNPYFIIYGYTEIISLPQKK